MKNKAKFLFVTGCARSGTSALTLALNRHSEVAIGMERYISKLFATGTYTPELFDEDRFFSINPNDTFYRSFEEVALDLKPDSYRMATYVGDKVPKIYLHYKMILEDIPDAKFLFLVRNPLSVAASFKGRAEDEKDQHWPSSRGVESAISDWNASLARTLPLLKSGSVLPLSFERLFFDGLGWRKVENFLKLGTSFSEKKTTDPKFKFDTLTRNEISYVVETADWDTYSEILAEICEGSDHDIYSASDRALINYNSKRVPGISVAMRDASITNLVCLGSAATFGRFIKDPFPKQLAASNLGIGGARPDSFLFEPAILTRIAKSNTTIFEITSARGYGGKVFQPINRFTNMIQVQLEFRNNNAFSGLGDRVFIDRIWDRAFLAGGDLVQDMINHAQEQWVAEMKDLIKFSRRPILFWFAQQEIPRTTTSKSSYIFPHFVTCAMIDQLDAQLVKLVSKVGIPYQLVDDNGVERPLLTGWPNPAINTYYPSQEMHDLAYQVLTNKI